MKRILMIAAVLSVVAAPAMAGMSVQMNLPPAGYTRFGDAGPFLATVGQTDPILYHPVGDWFITMCLEHNEYFDPGQTYTVGLSLAAILGGNGGPSDPLSNASAGLYMQYLSLSVAQQKAKGSSYQEAIWWLEQEIAGAEPALAVAAEAKWGVKTINYAGNQVRVMNLTQNGELKQDMLVAYVPVPGAALLGVIGLGVIGWAKRRLA